MKLILQAIKALLRRLEKRIDQAIPAPETAEVGQIVRVATVDENGKPTEWEAVDFPRSFQIDKVTLADDYEQTGQFKSSSPLDDLSIPTTAMGTRDKRSLVYFDSYSKMLRVYYDGVKYKQVVAQSSTQSYGASNLEKGKSVSYEISKCPEFDVRTLYWTSVKVGNICHRVTLELAREGYISDTYFDGIKLHGTFCTEDCQLYSVFVTTKGDNTATIKITRML